jgi:outer membrane lipoprotein SlyB
VIQGTLTFERPVDLYVSDSATVGKIEGATAQKFSGSAP